MAINKLIITRQIKTEREGKKEVENLRKCTEVTVMAVPATADGPLLGSTAPNKGHASHKLTSHASGTACTISSCPSLHNSAGQPFIAQGPS